MMDNVDGSSTSALEAERLDQGYFQDPLGLFARLREETPVKQVLTPRGELAWLVTRYDDVRAALSDPRLSMDTSKLRPTGWKPNPVFGYLNTNLLSLDPPDHSRLRRLVSKAFTPRRVVALRPRVEAVAAELVAAMAGQDEVDLVQAYAFPLPITVICELLGIAAADREQFQEWSRNVFSSVITPDEFRQTAAAVHRYFTELLAERGRAPGDDLLSALITVRDAGDALTEHELIAMMLLLIVAGHETTMNLIAGGVLALLSDPAEMQRLRAEPELLSTAVEELLRYVNPVNHATERVTVEAMEIGGVTVPANQWVICATSAANHDPFQFAAPSQLDVARDASGHLAFGHGIHYCLGAPLARMEAEIAFGTLLSRFPSMTLAIPDSALRWRQSSLMHGLETLPVKLGD
jgi:cytochrome P450